LPGKDDGVGGAARRRPPTLFFHKISFTAPPPQQQRHSKMEKESSSSGNDDESESTAGSILSPLNTMAETCNGIFILDTFPDTRLFELDCGGSRDFVFCEQRSYSIILSQAFFATP
jgi:hypothetical protein